MGCGVVGGARLAMSLFAEDCLRESMICEHGEECVPMAWATAWSKVFRWSP